MQTVLTIAGFDPSSGAGVSADLAVMAAHDLFGTSCITALTVQSTLGVKAWKAAGAAWVTDTLAVLSADLPPAGVKVGMLADPATVEAVTAFLWTLAPEVPVVLDPVLRSTSGAELLPSEGLAAMRRLLLRRVTWVTPNVDELALLSGMPTGGPGEIERAAEALALGYPGLGVIATGGHLARPDDLVLSPGAAPAWLAGERVETRSTHGTGCAFSTAMLCALVAGRTGLEAARQAKAYTQQGMIRAEARGRGRGPLELYWPLRD